MTMKKRIPFEMAFRPENLPAHWWPDYRYPREGYTSPSVKNFHNAPGWAVALLPDDYLEDRMGDVRKELFTRFPNPRKDNALL